MLHTTCNIASHASIVNTIRIKLRNLSADIALCILHVTCAVQERVARLSSSDASVESTGLPQIGQRISLRERVYEVLKDRIVNGHFAGGHQLIANQLSEQLGVSRTPVREALQRLQVEGLVVSLENGISAVAEVTHKRIEAATQIRELLEVFACRSAATFATAEHVEALRELHQRELESLQKVDEKELSELNSQIHKGVIKAAGNEILLDVIEYLLARVPSYRLFALGSREDLARFVDDHGKIIEAISRGDPDTASEIMSLHVRRAQKLLSAIHTEMTEA